MCYITASSNLIRAGSLMLTADRESGSLHADINTYNCQRFCPIIVHSSKLYFVAIVTHRKYFKKSSFFMFLLRLRDERISFLCYPRVST